MQLILHFAPTISNVCESWRIDDLRLVQAPSDPMDSFWVVPVTSQIRLILERDAFSTSPIRLWVEQVVFSGYFRMIRLFSMQVKYLPDKRIMSSSSVPTSRPIDLSGGSKVHQTYTRWFSQPTMATSMRGICILTRRIVVLVLERLLLLPERR